MKFKQYGMLLTSLGLLVSCINDNVDESQCQNLQGEGYLSLSMVEKGETRAEGDDSAIKSVLLILADEEDNQKLVGEGVPQSDKWVFSYSNNDFTTLTSLPEAHVYVVCNLAKSDYDVAGSASAGSKPVQKILNYTTDDGKYWKNETGFLMSNSKVVKKSLDVLAIKNGKYSSPNTPFDLGTVEVQRTMARLDLAQGQPVNVLADPSVKIIFKGVSLVNLSQKFFLYKEVGTPGNFTMFEEENSTNWVNDPKVGTTYSYDLINRVTSAQRPGDLVYNNIDFGASEITDQPQFSIYRYVTPNTVTKLEDQVVGKITGLVYKAQITSASGNLNVAPGEDLLVYYDKVVGGKSYISSLSSSSDGVLKNVYDAYTEAVKGKTGDTQIKEALKNAGFTSYPAAEDNNYYCYYYYWVRHNAVGSSSDGIMDSPMEYGVVRNNIYGISVKKVHELGKPGDYEPNPEEAADPAKDPDTTSASLTVAIEVKPWYLRTDDVEF